MIEDDEDIGRLIQGAPTHAGILVFLERTRVSAVRQHRPLMVLLDYGLPDIDGFEVIRQIRGYILMLTGHTDASELLMAAGSGCHEMTQLFRPRMLRAHVQETLGLPGSSRN